MTDRLMMVYHDYYAKTDAPSNIFSSDLETQIPYQYVPTKIV